MSRPSSDWELAIALPLGVVDQQLRKIEEQLRGLNTRALQFEQHELRPAWQSAEGHLQRIRELLGAIGGLVDDIDSDLHAGDVGDTPRKPTPQQDD